MKFNQLIASVCFLICSVFTAAKIQAQEGRSGRSAKPISYGAGRSGVLFDVAVYYGQSQASADPAVGNEWKSTSSIYDIKLGYVNPDGYYGGAQYSTYTQSNAATLSTTANDTQSGGGAAVGVGYLASNGFSLRSYYRFNETFGDYKDGAGFQVDGGFSVNMTSNFFVGFSVSHRQVTFKENRLISGFDYWTKKETYPFLTLGFLIK